MKRDQDYVLVDLLTYEKLSDTSLHAEHKFKNGVKVEVVHRVGGNGTYTVIIEQPDGPITVQAGLSKLHANYALRDAAEMEF